MRFLAFIFLLAALRCSGQNETVYKVSKAKLITADSLKKNYQLEINQILGLPDGQNVISCNIYFASHGEVEYVKWAITKPDYWSDIRRILNVARPKDRLTFANIFIKKGEKTIMVADKTIEY